MAKLDLHKMKEKFSGLEKFGHKYLVETLTVVAIVVGALSAWTHLFVGTLGWVVLFLCLGAAVGLFFSATMDHWMRKVYSFSSGEKKTYTIAAEAMKIAIALFLPFLYFAFLGVLGGTAYQYYIRHSQPGHNKGSKAA